MTIGECISCILTNPVVSYIQYILQIHLVCSSKQAYSVEVMKASTWTFWFINVVASIPLTVQSIMHVCVHMIICMGVFLYYST